MAVVLTDSGGSAFVVRNGLGRATFNLRLFELTRVIELYNVRAGATRTGQFHAEAGTEDGFAPGP